MAWGNVGKLLTQPHASDNDPHARTVFCVVLVVGAVAQLTILRHACRPHVALTEPHGELGATGNLLACLGQRHLHRDRDELCRWLVVGWRMTTWR